MFFNVSNKFDIYGRNLYLRVIADAVGFYDRKQWMKKVTHPTQKLKLGKHFVLN